MCGVVGTYGFVDEPLLKEMADAISHRGPDGEGFYVGRNGAIGSRRLAIIDVATGQMPIANEDGTIFIVYNGEIYNFAKLTSELKNSGHTFKTKSDTEMVLHAYEEWGEDCVRRFNGMFAFALYNTKKGEIFVARDQFGIKPFYYLKDGEKFVFASEIKALLRYNGYAKSPNDRAIIRYLASRKHDDTRETFFEGIYKLLPGEYGVFSRVGLKTTKYYNVNINAKATGTKKELVEKFRILFVKSVKDRLMSEVPIGTCLSGGIDSSSIVCVINDLLRKSGLDEEIIGTKQRTFSAVFPKEINDEEQYIHEVLKFTETQKNFVFPRSSEFFDELEAFVYSQEEPMISSGPYSQWCVMKLAREQVKVLLDGQGADEVLAGYTPYFFVYLRQLFKEKKYLLSLKEGLFALPQVKPLIIEWLKNNYRKIPTSVSLLNQSLVKNFSGKEEVVSDNLKKRLYNDLLFDSIPALLRYEDKNSMAFSIEGRVPFLDTDLVEFVFSLPEDLIIRNGRSKFILREAVKDLVPKRIVKRTWKVGFTTPEVAWFRAEQERVYQIVESESFRRRKYFDYPRVKSFVDDFYQGKHNESMVLWRLINVEMWLRAFHDQ